MMNHATDQLCSRTNELGIELLLKCIHNMITLLGWILIRVR